MKKHGDPEVGALPALLRGSAPTDSKKGVEYYLDRAFNLGRKLV
jgi:hypothetical protein